jgi:hypothetical protein
MLSPSFILRLMGKVYLKAIFGSVRRNNSFIWLFFETQPTKGLHRGFLTIFFWEIFLEKFYG